MKVYIVMKGSNYEGGEVVAVTKYRTMARSIVRKIRQSEDFSPGYQWAMFFKFRVRD
jgi:hypothetical protein